MILHNVMLVLCNVMMVPCNVKMILCQKGILQLSLSLSLLSLSLSLSRAVRFIFHRDRDDVKVVRDYSPWDSSPEGTKPSLIDISVF